MHFPLLKFFACSTLACLCIIGCQHTHTPSPKSSFAAAQAVLERNCVHCHGEIRLPQMPSIATSKSLGDLIGPGKWVVPGQPEASRLFQVVTLNDDQAGAMPPTGHKITAPEIAQLRAWILAGAIIPESAPEVFRPRGVPPRSR